MQHLKADKAIDAWSLKFQNNSTVPSVSDLIYNIGELTGIGLNESKQK